jgi:hypothetical protein
MIWDSGEEAAEAAVFALAIGVPHFLQNRAPALTDALQAEQINSSFVPHSSQNEASPGLSRLQAGQRIGPPVVPVTTTPCRGAKEAPSPSEHAVES